MILTYFVIAPSEEQALEQLTDSVPVPFYCGVNRRMAEMARENLTSADTKERNFDLFTIALLVERTK
jgi:hypothetical protein